MRLIWRNVRDTTMAQSTKELARLRCSSLPTLHFTPTREDRAEQSTLQRWELERLQVYFFRHRSGCPTLSAPHDAAPAHASTASSQQWQLAEAKLELFEAMVGHSARDRRSSPVIIWPMRAIMREICFWFLNLIPVRTCAALCVHCGNACCSPDCDSLAAFHLSIVQLQ